MGREGSGGGGNLLFGCQASGGRKQRNEEQEPPHYLHQTQRHVVPGGVGVQSAEGTAIVGRAAYVRVENLGEAMRPAVVDVSGGRSGRIPVSFGGEGDYRAGCAEDQNGECGGY